MISSPTWGKKGGGGDEHDRQQQQQVVSCARAGQQVTFPHTNLPPEEHSSQQITMPSAK
jgi:hypothetical protein